MSKVYNRSVSSQKSISSEKNRYPPMSCFELLCLNACKDVGYTSDRETDGLRDMKSSHCRGLYGVAMTITTDELNSHKLDWTVAVGDGGQYQSMSVIGALTVVIGV